MALDVCRLVPPLRVGCCFGTYPPERNGGADFLARFAAALGEAGAEVLVLTSPADAPAVEAPAPGVSVHRIVADWGLRGLGPANDALRAHGTQLVHVFFPDPGLGGGYRLPSLLGARLQVPLVTTFWNLGLGSRSPLTLRAQALALLARSSALTSHDPGYLEVLRRLGAGRPVHWLPVGNNMAGAEAPDREVTDSYLPGRSLAYFGQLDFTRGVDDLFRALRLVRDREDARLVMIGSAGREERYAEDGSAYAQYRALRALPRELGIEEAVEWTDYLADGEVTRLLSSVDLCVLPYRRNSLGRSALAAALDAGAPTLLAGRPELIGPLRPGRHVALVPPDSPDLLAEAILRLLGDEGERRRLAAGAVRASRLFAWPRIAAAALGIYRRVLCA